MSTADYIHEALCWFAIGAGGGFVIGWLLGHLINYRQQAALFVALAVSVPLFNRGDDE